MDSQDSQSTETYQDGDYSMDPSSGMMAEVPTAVADSQEQIRKEDQANELLESLLHLPDSDDISEEMADIPALEDHPSADIDYCSPSDTLTTSSVSSLASPPAIEEKSVRFELPGPSASIYSLQPDERLASIFLPGIEEDDFAFPISSPSSTPTIKSRFLQNPTSSPDSKVKRLSSPSLFANLYSSHDSMSQFLHGSPSRHTSFDIDLMPDWAFDTFVQA